MLAVLAATAFIAVVHRADDLRLDAVRRTIPFAPTGYRVHALFQETGQLVPGADVRISGVNVGKVTNVRPGASTRW